MNDFQIYDKYVKPDSIVYDIGAFIGEHANYFAKLGAKPVYAFEPSNNNFDELAENTKKNLSVYCYKVALHTKSYECITRFRDCTDSRKPVPQDGEQPIKYVILRDFIDENNLLLPDFVKIDIEGMESMLLNTFDFLFTSSRPIIFVEVHVAPRGIEPQNYKDNPHWLYPDEGGFDFNDLKKHDYIMLDNNGNEIMGDYNPVPKTHTGRILIPKEKL